ncbi:hypothetical protein D039_0973, partial [Vibrio parahaemolyticus EKP-028]
MIIKL